MSSSVVFASVSVFLFFKQKTAYEMRISDWSSDVCSSDLHGQTVHVFGMIDSQAPRNPAATIMADKMKIGEAQHVHHIQLILRHRTLGIVDEIGRASGRERVCTYV